MNCGIIQDLLPLYHDGVCSPESRAAVEAHLRECPACREALEAMDAPLPPAEAAVPDDAAVVRRLSWEWRKGRRRSLWKGALLALALCAVLLGGLWVLNTWTVLPVDSNAYEVRAYRLGDGRMGIHYNVDESGWYILDWREEADGVHWYLKKPLLHTAILNFDHRNDSRSGDALFSQEDAMGTQALYFGLGETTLLLWRKGEQVDLPAATQAEASLWAPLQEVPAGEKDCFS